MKKTDAKQRIAKLKEVIEHHRYLYHVLDTQEISDSALDSLKHELYTLEQEYPEFITPDSPTQRVGGQPREQFAKITHRNRMLSMEDIFSEEELQAWMARVDKLADAPVTEYFTMPKIDGLAVSLTYEDGLLKHAATRGNGTVGEDVTENIKTLESVPIKLKQSLPGVIDVRGEVYITHNDFEALNHTLEKAGEKTYANPRNLAAGSIRQLDPAMAAARPLRFIAWHLEVGDEQTQAKSMQVLKKLGFKTVPGDICAKAEDLTAAYNKTLNGRDKFAYWIDGLVVRVNNHQQYNSLGVVGKTPRGLVAWKFPAEEATTVVREVNWFVGRTGKLTPVATVDPTAIAGTTVTHATLHNVDEIRRLDLQIGDTVILTKSGDIIPKITNVLTDLRDNSQKPFVFPSICPSCDTPLTPSETGVDLLCTNQNCFSKTKESILHAVRAFDIMGLGEKTVETFLRLGYLTTPADLFRLPYEEIAQLEGFGDVSAEKLRTEIEQKKTITLAAFLTGLSIPNVGSQTASTLARTFGSLEQLQQATQEELEAIRDIGSTVAQSILDFFADPHTQKLLTAYEAVGITITKPEKQGTALQNQTFVLTGTLETLTRDAAKQLIEANGGHVTSSVSNNTTYVLAGSSAGSKLAKAEALGVKILSEQAFLDMVSPNR